MVKLDIYGRGLPLRMAIMFTCQLAFIFFGTHPIRDTLCMVGFYLGMSANFTKAMTKVCFLALSATVIS